MKKFLILSLFSCQLISANQSLEQYFGYLSQLDQSKGNEKEGEIEVVTDPLLILQIQKTQENRLLQKGFSPDEAAEFSRIGIINEDQYWIWLRDAVYFPQQMPGTYDRLIWRSELKGRFPGVAVLPISPSGKIMLILTYRHATRSWEFEIPRGAIEPQETPEEAAFRELKEETGFLTSSINFLGEMATDSGAQSSVVPVFLGKIAGQEEPSPEYSEAIAGIYAFTKDEIKEGLVSGFLEVTKQNRKHQISLRDPFLTFALLQAECRKLL